MVEEKTRPLGLDLRPIPELLQKLIDKEKKLSYPSPQEASRSSDLLKWYQNTDNFTQVYKMAMKLLLTPRTNAEISLLRRNLAGKVFEDIAYFFLAATLNGGSRVVFSPQTAYELWKRLYPKSSQISSIFGTYTLEEANVPDGLIVEDLGLLKSRIISICEYTTHPQSASGKIGVFLNASNYYSRQFNGVNLLFVTPEYVDLNILAEVPISQKHVPFGTRVFGQFVTDIFGSYRTNQESGTLDEVQERVRQQRERGLIRQKNGPLTKEFGIYLQKLSSATRLS